MYTHANREPEHNQGTNLRHNVFPQSHHQNCAHNMEWAPHRHYNALCHPQPPAIRFPGYPTWMPYKAGKRFPFLCIPHPEDIAVRIPLSPGKEHGTGTNHQNQAAANPFPLLSAPKTPPYHGTVHIVQMADLYCIYHQRSAKYPAPSGAVPYLASLSAEKSAAEMLEALLVPFVLHDPSYTTHPI